ncbi:MAG TPA: START domain-containing protein [Bacteroidales bacterium]
MIGKILGIIAILSAIQINGVAQETDWKLEKEKDGISVFTREVGGLKIKEFKATATIRTNTEFLVAMVLDAETYVDWIDKMEVAEIIEKVNSNEFYIYSEVDVPWPFENRDIVTLNKVNRNHENGSVKIEIAAVTGKVPEKEGVVRMPESGGFWQFTPQKDGKTAVVYQYLADPGGGIPDWLVNAFLVDGPYKTLENMKRIAEEN